MIKKFSRVEGKYIEKIDGQDRFAYSHSDSIEFYELMELMEYGGCEGNEIRFYDFYSGQVYCPFEKKRNVIYGDPVYYSGLYYFLKADYDEGTVVLYCYYPGELSEQVKEFDINEVSLYNLTITGNGIHVVSQGDVFRCYYPEQFSFLSGEHESVIFIDNGTVYCQKWIEEGWDDRKNCRTEDYNYYDKIVKRDFDGNILSEETGSLFRNTDGTWWIA